MENKILLEKLNELFIKYQNNVISVTSNIRFDAELKELILNATKHLLNAGLGERLFYLKNNGNKGVCKNCGKDTKFLSFTKGYRDYCSGKCAQSHEEVRQKFKISLFAKYGVENPSQLSEFQEKKKQTWIENYGTDHPFKSEQIKNKIKQTNLDNLGVEYPQQSMEVRNKSKKTVKEKYGVEHISQLDSVKEKKKETCLGNFGVEYSWQSDIIKEKSKQTWIEKYGVESPNQDFGVKEKKKQTTKLHYGVENPAQSPVVQERMSQTSLIRYGVDNPGKSPIVQKKRSHTRLVNFYNSLLTSNRVKKLIIPLFTLDQYVGSENKYPWKCVKCDNVFEGYLHNGKIPRCLVCFPYIRKTSHYEVEIEKWLLSLSIKNIVKNDRSVISPKELDIYLPDFKLAIEFNGLWAHSELDKGEIKGKNPQYHLNKTNACKAKGIQLIHIFEDEWVEKQDIVKSIIKSRLGLTEDKIYARKCEIKKVENREAKNFLFDNHLSPPMVRKKANFGLFYKDELVYLVVIGKPRFSKNYQYEVLRSCGKINTQISGGFSKLIKCAVNELKIISLVSYVDRRYFTGRGYGNWDFMGNSDPSYFYTKDYTNRESRMNYQKYKMIENEEDKKLAEWTLMQLAGYDRVWDCGTLTYSISL
jgi:hypothetical protein